MRTWEFGFLTEDVPVLSLLDDAFSHPQRDFPVLRGRELVGLVTRADIARGMRGGAESVTVGAIMRRNAPLAHLNEPLADAVRRMLEAGLKILSVMDDAGFAGLLKWDEASHASLEQEAQNAAAKAI